MPPSQRTSSQLEYFTHLCVLINEHAHRREYKDLCYWLFHQRFYSIMPNDDNRASDGEALRARFGVQLDDECSMMEMMVALAERMEFITYDGENEFSQANWFWFFVRNLDLDPVDIKDEDNYNVRNFAIIRRFIERKYARNGKGGLFPPLRHNQRDQRSVEIWYQMMAYLEELERYGSITP